MAIHLTPTELAILELLRAHGGGDGTLEELEVVYAELELRMRGEGHGRSRLIRLRPDRCSLDQTPLGERLYRCLVRWGIAHAA